MFNPSTLVSLGSPSLPKIFYSFSELTVVSFYSLYRFQGSPRPPLTAPSGAFPQGALLYYHIRFLSVKRFFKKILFFFNKF